MMVIDEHVERLLAEAASEEKGEASGAITEQSFARLLEVGLPAEPPRLRYRARDGFEIAYRFYPSADSSRAVILVHGSAAHGAHMHGLASHIATHGLAEVYVPDVRGHGLSGSRAGDEVSYSEQLRDDLLDLIGMVRQKRRESRIVLAGHSAGGGLILRVATSPESSAIAGYVLLAPFLGAGAPTSRAALGGWVRLYERRVRAVAELNRRGIPWLNRLPVIEFNQPFATRDGRETLSWSFNTMKAFGPRDWKADLGAIGRSRPVLVILAEADECFVSTAYYSTLGELVPEARFHLVDGAGHWDLLAAVETADAVCGWLSVL